MPLDSTGTAHPAPRTAASRPRAAPRAAREAAALAWHLAASAKRTATADAGRATKEAIEAGVLFDHIKHPREPGTECVVYNGAAVRITLKVGQQGSSLDVDAFLEALLLAGVPPAKLRRLVARHTHTTAAPHLFTSSSL